MRMQRGGYLAAALFEAIKGFGTDDLHTAAARLHLASHYKYRGKYDLALPLYNEVEPCCIPVRLLAFAFSGRVPYLILVT